MTPFDDGELSVDAFHPERMEALLNDGSVIPIVFFYDDEEEETMDFDEAVAFVCGCQDLWFSCYIDGFEPALTC